MLGTPQGTERALKRKRESAPSSPTGFYQHETLYLEDGDIVLTAPYRKGRLAFRVDKIFLARHSPIFKDMLAFSPGLCAEDMYEGVPRVDLTDDAEDLAILLGRMYNRPTLSLPKYSADKPLRFSGPIRLAMKYEIEEIKNTMIKEVEDDWPQSLDAYEAWFKERARIIRSHSKDFWNHIPEPASAMQFATEFGCNQMIDAVIYHLARASPDDALPVDRKTSQQPHRVRWNLLDGRNLFRVLYAHADFRSNWLPKFRALLIGQSPLCMSKHCYQTMHTLVNSAANDVLESTSVTIDRLRTCGICRRCIGVIEENAPQIHKLQVNLWKTLRCYATIEPVPW
ncbi:hypothetical protein EIP86_002825 [Pleurotus ostreatoroseus]|nr:hypothetical protein EIP86_002825 [Pleurotus ostreatoroseus]